MCVCVCIYILLFCGRNGRSFVNLRDCYIGIVQKAHLEEMIIKNISEANQVMVCHIIIAITIETRNGRDKMKRMKTE